MSVGRPRRNSFRDEVDEDGNVLWHGVKLGEFWKTDLQVAINDSNRRKDASFSIRMGKTGTTQPYQQPIPMDFARYNQTLYMKDITLEGPTGQTWTTVMRPSHQVVRFSRGWRQFSLENHLQEGYQLLFTLRGRLRLQVQFFDHLGKRCTTYPPLPGSLPVAETQRQPGFQLVGDGGQASHRHGSEAQTSAAVPLMGTTPNSAIPLISDQDNMDQHGPDSSEVRGPKASLLHEHLRVPTFDPRDDSEDTETEDEETDSEALAEDDNYIVLKDDDDDDDDDVLFRHPPATKPAPVIPERKILTLNELLLRKKKKVKTYQAHPTHIPYSNSSSDDEPPYMELKRVKKPVTRKKVTVKRRSPAAPPVAGSHKVGDSSGSSSAMRLLQHQGCMRFSDIISECKRRDVSNRERRVVRRAAEQFASKLGNEKFLVVMREAQVYQGFHLTIPGKILEATGTERASKVEVCLLDREQAQYKAYWTRQNFFELPLLDRDAWAKFAVDHALEEGDVCVFQLLPQLPQSKPTFLFFVHIFHVVETHDFSDSVDVQ